MKLLIRITALCLVLALAVPMQAESAGDLFNKGRDAEARNDYVAAYQFYFQAHQRKPKDVRYKASLERSRFLASASLVNRGQTLREQGKLEEAAAEFRRALEINPSHFLAQQELRRTLDMIEKAKTTPPGQAKGPEPSVLGRRVEQAAGPVELAPISDVPITLNMTEDTRTIYSSIGKLAGINVLFDPDYTSRRIRVELNGVSLTEALEVVALESRTFWRAVTPNTIFVAADNPNKRRELERHVLKTFYLENLSQNTEIQDVLNVLRTVLGLRLIMPMQSQAAIVVRGTPDQVALAEKVIGDLDKARPEVIVEVAVMQVSRSKLRDLGIQPPTSASVVLSGNLQNNNNNNNQNGTGTGTTTGTQGTVTLNRLGNLDARDFNVTIPAASVSFLMSDSNTKLIQNPQIRALDGQKATLKIGDRVPVATGSFGGGITGVGLSSLVNTQFNYVDVGVNIDMTPNVHAGREVTLRLTMDISSVTDRVNIGGIDQPVIGQRKVEHQIRLREGEINLIGGIFENEDRVNLSGFPWLSQVPILKYLFSQENVERRENEIVFVLIPRIVRGQEITPLNVRPLDVGTENTIDLRRIPSARPAPPQGAAPNQGGPAQQVRPSAAPAAQPAPTANGQQTQATFSFEPPMVTPTAGSSFTIDVIMNGQNIHSVPVQLSYDPKKLQLMNVSNGTLLSRDGQVVTLVHRGDTTTGTVQMTATRPPNSGGVSGQGSVFTLTFVAKEQGQSPIVITQAGVRDANMQQVAVTGTQAQVTIK